MSPQNSLHGVLPVGRRGRPRDRASPLSGPLPTPVLSATFLFVARCSILEGILGRAPRKQKVDQMFQDSPGNEAQSRWGLTLKQPGALGGPLPQGGSVGHPQSSPVLWAFVSPSILWSTCSSPAHWPRFHNLRAGRDIRIYISNSAFLFFSYQIHFLGFFSGRGALYSVACGILVPQQGLKPSPRQ